MLLDICPVHTYADMRHDKLDGIRSNGIGKNGILCMGGLEIGSELLASRIFLLPVRIICLSCLDSEKKEEKSFQVKEKMYGWIYGQTNQRKNEKRKGQKKNEKLQRKKMSETRKKGRKTI